MFSQQSESQDTPFNDVVMKQRRVRGKSRGKHLAILLKATPAKKLPIIIPRDAGVPVGEYAAKFSSELSFAVKNTAPLNVRKWLEVSAEVKNNIYKNMQSKFIFEDDSINKSHILHHANKLYREWRHTLHRDNYMKYETDAERLQNRPEDVSEADWAFVVDFFGGDDFKKVSTRNKRNREKEGVTQITGRKSFQSISYNLRDPKTGDKPTELELWRITHERPDGRWADERSKNAYEEMVDLLTQPQVSPTGDEVVNLTPREVLNKVVGERSGHARGLGCGPRGFLKPNSKRYTQDEMDQVRNERNEIAERMTHLEDTFEARVQATVANEIKAQVDNAVQEALSKFMELSRRQSDSNFDASLE